MAHTPDNLGGPLFPNGFEGDDTDMDHGGLQPAGNGDRRLWTFDIDPRSDEHEKAIEGLRRKGALYAARIDSLDLDDIERQCQRYGWRPEIEEATIDGDQVLYVAVFVRENE